MKKEAKYQIVLRVLQERRRFMSSSSLRQVINVGSKTLSELRRAEWVDYRPQRGWEITKKGVMAYKKGYQLAAALRGKLITERPKADAVILIERKRLKAAIARKEQAEQRFKKKVAAMQRGDYFSPALSTSNRVAMALAESNHTLATLAEKLKENPTRVYSALRYLGDLVLADKGRYTARTEIADYLAGKSLLSDLKINATEQKRLEAQQLRLATQQKIKEKQGQAMERRYREVGLSEIRLPKPKAQFISGWVVL